MLTTKTGKAVKLSAAKHLTQRTQRCFAALSMTFLIAFPKLPTDLACESSLSASYRAAPSITNHELADKSAPTGWLTTPTKKNDNKDA
jgi:hypothetical protein